MKVVVVGGGVIGLCTAYYLGRGGANVVVVERGRPGGGCSLRNGGWICPSLLRPLPAPGAILGSLRRIFRPDSPLYIRAAALPRLLRWLLAFGRHCNAASYAAGMSALLSLGGCTSRLYRRLADAGVRFEYGQGGMILAFSDMDELRKSADEIAGLSGYGIEPAEALDREGLARAEPDLRGGLAGGLLLRSVSHVRPESLCAGLAESVRLSGGSILGETTVGRFASDKRTGTGYRVRAALARATPGPDRRAAGDAGASSWTEGESRAGGEGGNAIPQAELAQSAGHGGGRPGAGREIEADAFVIAAGAESGALAAKLGSALPVQAVKGYSITVERPNASLSQPVYLAGPKVGFTPFRGAMRTLGTLEFSGFDERLDSRRIAVLERAAQRYLPGALRGRSRIDWVGLRPVMPDGLPAIGRLPGTSNVYVATGHQMLGVTLAPATGRALARLMLDGGPDARLAPFDPGRFH